MSEFLLACLLGIGRRVIAVANALLQLAATVADAGRRAVDFSGEEAAARVRLRAERLDLSAAPAAVAAEMSAPATSARHVKSL